MAARGWLSGGEPEEEVASGGLGVWEQVVGELGLVGALPMSSGLSWWAPGDAGACIGVFKTRRGSSGGCEGVWRAGRGWSGRENWLREGG